MNISEIEAKLQTKLGSRLEEEIAKKLKEGAINKISALNKIYKEQKAEKIGVDTIEGLFLGANQRKFRDYNIWLATKDGVKRTTSAESPEAVKSMDYIKANVDIFQNLDGAKWTQLNTIEIVPHESVVIGDFFSPTTNGMMVFNKATIKMVSEVSLFEGGQPIESLPIFGPEGLNLRLAVSLQDKDASVRLYHPNTLAELIGDFSWVESLPQDKAVRELSDTLGHTEVLVFGRYVSEIDGKAVRPFVDIRNGFIRRL